MKGILAVFALLVLVLAVPAIAQENPGSDDNFPKGWREVSLATRVAYLDHGIQQDLDALPKVRKFIEGSARKFPYKDDGMVVQLGERPEPDPAVSKEILFVGVLVTGVWTDSPADKVGVLPGDWIVSVEGKPACGKAPFLALARKDLDRSQLDAAQSSCVENVIKITNEKFANDPTVETYTQEIERNGKILTFKVGRALIGESVRKFADDNFPKWDAAFAASGAALQKLLAELTVGGEDEKQIDDIYLKFKAIDANIDEPAEEFLNFMRDTKRQKTLAAKVSAELEFSAR